MKELKLPVSFEEVPYFKHAFRGDLIITLGVIYYFPRINTSVKERKVWHEVTRHFGLIGFGVDVVLRAGSALIRNTVNRSRLRKEGLWLEGDSSPALQTRLDAHIAELKRQDPQLVRYEYSLPKPMRFAVGEIKNLSTRGGLKFETAFDQHDFSIAPHRRKLLREALWMAGFRQ
ncbi:MAG: hypothetical protein JOZ52_07950 [Acidobacteria bacterium]|nr:hypothetical protein [Acidobacteriota bacterium]